MSKTTDKILEIKQVTHPECFAGVGCKPAKNLYCQQCQEEAYLLLGLFIQDKHTRPDWDTYFMKIAEDVASRSTCPRASVGAVIVKDKHILSTGYNGAPPGEPHCLDVGCLMINDHCERTVHAETNAVVQAAKFGVNINGATLYCWSERHATITPFEGKPGEAVQNCIKCNQVMKAAGIISVINNPIIKA